MTDEFLAVQQGQPGKIDSGGRPASYRPFTRILAGDRYPPGTFTFSADLKIRRKSHVLPGTHRLFTVMSPRELIANELHGPCPLDWMPCCGLPVAHVPLGDTIDDLRWVPDVVRILRHQRACFGRMIRERPHGAQRRRARTKRSWTRTRHVGDADDWGWTFEYIPPLGINGPSAPKTRYAR